MNDLEKEEYAIQQELLQLLGEIQRNTAPIAMSIGYTDENNMCRNGIIITKAAPLVVNKLVEHGYNLDIIKQGVRVYKI